jgi:hypothetical protein
MKINEWMREKSGGSGKLQQLPPMALHARNIIWRGAYYISVSKLPARPMGIVISSQESGAKRAIFFGQQRLRQKQRYQNSKHQVT